MALGTKRLEGKVALVTGASSGIGAASAVALAGAGARLVLTARRADRLEEVRQRIVDGGGSDPLVLVCDIADDAARAGMVAQALGQFGRVDLLVNNAGYAQPAVVEDLTPGRLREQVEVNLIAAIDMMRLVLPSMRSNGGGRIIAMSSTGGKMAGPGLAAYCATKHGLEGACDSLRVEARAHGILVSIIAPGAVMTDIWAEGKRRNPQDGFVDGPFAAVYQALERIGQRAVIDGAPPEQVAAFVLRAAMDARPKARYTATRSATLGAMASHLPIRWRDGVVRRAVGLVE